MRLIDFNVIHGEASIPLSDLEVFGERTLIAKVGDTFIPEEDCIREEREVFNAWRALYPNGKQEVSPDIKQVKQRKLNELWKACNEAILAGFYSSASGEQLFYGFDMQDQANLTEQAVLIDGTPDTITWKIKGDLHFAILTKEQFKNLCLDGKAHKETNMQKYFKLSGKVGECTTMEQLKTIVW